MYVQITQCTGTVRGPVDESSPPNDGLIELQLQPGERVVEVSWHEGWTYGRSRRKTRDWHWSVIIEHRLGLDPVAALRELVRLEDLSVVNLTASDEKEQAWRIAREAVEQAT